LACCLSGGVVPAAQAGNYRMSTLEWAPYTGADLPGLGFVSATIRDAMAAMGHTVDIHFFPWSRAVHLVDSDPSYMAFYPAYYSRERAQRYLFSEPVGRSTIVFLERTDKSVRWSNYDDLKGLRIGVVRGFVNTEELDARIANKTLETEEAPDDRSNVLKLAAGRVDLVVIDSHVYQHLVRTDTALAQVAPRLQANAKVLEVKNLYVCFQRTPAGEAALRALNTGLRRPPPRTSAPAS
jgi:polar amino acid transport system substrate-binding protein